MTVRCWWVLAATLAVRLSRLVRQTYSFFRCAEHHLDAVHFFVANYNLAIQQAAIFD